jgi:phosphatidylglycerol:prolipoprotein diacylglycerol transferase
MAPEWDPSIFWVAGILAALFWLDESARRSGLDRRRTLICGVLVVASGWLGARLVGMSAYHDPELGLMGGRSWFGGLLGGIAAALILVGPLRLPLRAWLDSAAAAVCLGYAVGRIGCFVNGCDYGTPSSMPWAVRYGPGFPAFDNHLHMGWIPPDAVSSLAVHPVQLYASAGALMLFFVVTALPRLRFCAFLAGYAILRLSLEPLRGDAHPVFATLSQTQLFALCALVASAALMMATRRQAAMRLT